MPELPSATDRPRAVRRRRWIMWTALFLVITMPMLFGVALFGLLASLDVQTVVNFNLGSGWFPAVGVGLVGTVVAFFVALTAVVMTRPRLLPVLVFLTSIVLPVVSTVVAVKLGGAILAQRFATNLDQGAAVIDQIADAVDRAGGGTGPLGELLRWLAG